MALTDNLISFWQLEEASGTRFDATPTGNNLADYFGNGTSSNPGIVGNAGQFVRTSVQALTIASNASLSLGTNEAFTWNVWVYLDSTTNDLTFVSKYGGGGGETVAYTVEVVASSNFRFRVGDGVATLAVVSATTFGAPTTATWYMVTAWRNSGALTINIAINAGATDSTASPGTTTESAAFAMGSLALVTNFMNGRIDQVGFWKRALVSAERTQLYNGGAGLSYAQMTASPRQTASNRKTASGRQTASNRQTASGRQNV